MTMLGIDISSYQSVEQAGMDGIEFVIVKATQGYNYINPKCDPQYQLAKSKNRLLGVYHYAEGLDPVKEAEFFVNNIKGYLGEATLWLDWEEGNNKSWGNTEWCLQFVNHVHAMTGIWCGVYVRPSEINQVANLSNISPIWVAGYPTNAPGWDVPSFIYSTAPWPVYTIWQFTSGGGLDKNIANLDADAWKRIASAGNGVAPTPTPNPEATVSPAGKSLEILAGEVQQGKYGNGDARTNALGQLYPGVQAIINHRSDQPKYAESTIETLTNETLAGVYGDGDARKNMLGNYYDAVQARINDRYSVRSYTVQSGDTLSGIGSKLGVNWQELANRNGIGDPNKIYEGQVLKY